MPRPEFDEVVDGDGVVDGVVDGDTALRDWAASGAMALTGRPDGPPLAAPGAPASYVRHVLAAATVDAATLAGRPVRLPGTEVLSERAAMTGISRGGPWSCGGAFRLLRTLDGWFGLALPRPDDLDLLPALTDGAVTPGPVATGPLATGPLATGPAVGVTGAARHLWASVAAWAGARTTAEASDRAALLGLAYSHLPDTHLPDGARGSTDDVAAVSTRALGHRTPRDRPLVVDLTSLWAGPLCADIVRTAGARVVKVESPRRPDGARHGSPELFALLHDGSEFVSLDLHRPADVDRLRALIARADLVLEASRPRALAQAGVDAEECVRAGTSWLSITARGRASGTIGFGDDIAAAAGLVVADGGELMPCGDALADPLTGVAAARHALAALLSTEARLIDLPMLAVARAAREFGPAAPAAHHTFRRDGRWWVDVAGARTPVEEPRLRC